MALTDIAIRGAKPKDKSFKLTDSGGLHLLVTPAGGKLWRQKYRFGGKEKQLTFGAYPEVSLRDARALRDAAKAALREGRDPGQQKALARKLGLARQSETFEAIARDWHARQTPTWTARHASDVLASLERLVFPVLGELHVNDITPPQVLGVIRHIEENNGGDTAQRVRQRMSKVFGYAIATGVGQTDPAAIIKGALAPVPKGRMPAVTTIEAAREVLAAVEAIPAHPPTKAAHRFLALTAVRPGEVNGARWEELDLAGEVPLWRIPAERMKMKEPHVVPLSRQAVAVIEAVRPYTGKCPFIFPNARFAHKPMSENAMSYLLKRAGFEGQHVPHGWRATFSTIMNQLYPGDADAIEKALAHTIAHKVRGAYNRAEYLDRRRELMQDWADRLLMDAVEIGDVLLGPRRPIRTIRV